MIDKFNKIDPNFFEECKARGFDFKMDTGGVRFEGGIKDLAFVDGDTFLKTVLQIESVVKYKLFM